MVTIANDILSRAPTEVSAARVQINDITHRLDKIVVGQIEALSIVARDHRARRTIIEGPLALQVTFLSVFSFLERTRTLWCP